MFYTAEKENACGIYAGIPVVYSGESLSRWKSNYNSRHCSNEADGWHEIWLQLYDAKYRIPESHILVMYCFDILVLGKF
jgi:hypothetical protein